ncbi:hypothetical protein LZC95_46550 [Pendulispora brunnea]|uniref:TPM domain-containing protein n=1 Tax=Pendulispora brunnea TaxID=2905690 RepID=A0ABZ2K5C2_9BACT
MTLASFAAGLFDGFFGGDAKARTSAAVKAVEACTSAEIVVAARRSSGNYRAADYHAGFVLMGVLVAYMLVSPTVFTLGTIALEGVCAFAIGAFLSAKVSVVRRWLVRKSTLADNVLRAGRAAFYELGISNTSGRNGILVFVSAFERTCVIVPDLGIRPDQLGAEYRLACDRLERATYQLDFNAFVIALEQLGPVLGKAMPRREDDINELPDEVQ